MFDLCHAVTEMSPIPIVGVEDAAHRISYVNPAFCSLVSKAKEELIGSSFSNVPVIGEKCSVILERVFRTGRPETCTVREGSGSFPHCSCAMWPVFFPERSSPGIIVQVIEETSIHQDTIAMNEALMLGLIRQHELTEVAEGLNAQLQAEIEARKRAEEALIRSEKLAFAGRMAAVIAHEINNPLSAVMDLIYLAERSEGITEPIQEYLATADAELKRIAHITRQTLGFYREMAAPTTFHVASLLDSVTDLLRAKIKSSGATVVLQCKEDLQIAAVHGELRQVLSNLLANGLDALGQEGMVTVRASDTRDPLNGTERIRLTVSDNGKGIEPAALSQIFEPFFSTKGDLGNGLGLWVCKQIIEKHGGQIQVRSSTDGQHRGTAFSLCLPKFAV
jgi:two-component system NtrC family sensor kinase